MPAIRSRLLLLCLPLFLLSCGDSGSDGRAAPAGVALAPVTGTLSLFAGGIGGIGSRDDNGVDARFNQPLGLAVAADGTTYVADLYNHVIRKISPAGDVTTLAGKAGEPGTADGAGTDARFYYPGGLALAADGTLYVADSGNSTLRKITPAGDVSTLAGAAGSPGATDGGGTAARFNAPYGMVLASDGNLYVADSENHIIRQVTPAGEVTTLAGSATATGTTNGSGSAARFARPVGIAVDAADVLYVTDSSNHNIRKVTLAGEVTTLAGGAAAQGSTDGTGSAARFFAPVGIAAAADGTLYVTDTRNHTVRVVTPAGEVATLAGQPGDDGYADASGSGARFNTPGGITFDSGGQLLVADTLNHVLRQLTLAGDVSTLYGTATQAGSTDAAGDAARFDAPTALVSGTDGTIYVADSLNHTIRAISAAGEVTTLAGLADTQGISDGAAATARFRVPAGLARDAAGVLYVADSGSHTIRKITPGGEVSTLAGVAGSAGSSNGGAGVARFNTPRGLAVDGDGNVYVADSGNHVIRKVTPAGIVSTLAGLGGAQGFANGSGTAARFYWPTDVALGLDGILYVADQGNHLIRAVTLAGVASTVAGGVQLAGAVDATGSAARFNAPLGIEVDADGTLYVTDAGNHLLRQVTSAGEVTTLAGEAGARGVLTGPLPGSLNLPAGLAIGGSGELYLTSENAVLKVALDSPAATFGVGLRASAGNVVVGQSVSLSWATADATNCIASGDWSGAQASGGSTTVSPGTAGTYSYTLTCDEDGGSASKSATATVTVSEPSPVLTLSASAPYVAPGESLTLTWSSAHVTSCTASGDWSGAQALSGSASLTPATGARSYTLDCSGPGGSVSRTVEVAVAPVPTVTLTASPTSMRAGISTLLTWSSSNATACTASGGWTGPRATSGSISVTPSSGDTVTYTLSCTGSGGAAADSVTVTVTQAGDGAGDSGGGALGLEGLGLLSLLLLRRRARAGE